MITKKLHLLFVVMVLLYACSNDDSSADGSGDCAQTYTDQVAAGQFSGQPFTIVDGKHRFVGTSENSFFSLYIDAIVGDLCGFPENTQSILFGFETELKVGNYPLSILNTVSFNTHTGNGAADIVLATCGEIEVISITETEITGRLKAEADTSNFINGNFTAKRCQ